MVDALTGSIMFESLFPQSFAARLRQVWASGTGGAISDAFDASVALRREAQSADDGLAEASSALQAAWFAFQIGRVEPGLEHATAAKRVFQTLGSAAGEAAAVAMGAWLLLEAGLTEEAAADAERALAQAGPSVEAGLLGFITNVLGVVLWYSGQAGMAIPFCAEAIALAERAGDPVAVAWWRINLAGAHASFGGQADGGAQGESGSAAIDEAIRINATALDLAGRTGDVWCQALALCNAAEFLCSAGRAEEALAHLAACDALVWTPMERSRAHFQTTRAEALLLQGCPEAALDLCQEALRSAAGSNNLEARMLLFRHIAAAYEQLGAFQDALQSFKQFHAAQQRLMVDKAQRHARIAGIRYETHRLREQAAAAQAQVASLVLKTQSDPLTGLANRRVFDRALADLERAPRPFALAVIDLDHFKGINDRFSHPVGDAVLSQVGAILAGVCSADDLVARIGGEEFMLLVAGSEPAAALPICEAFRHAIETFPWARHHPHLKVTTSIGIAQSSEAQSPPAVLALADRRLYQAKGLGRNCVVDASGAYRGASLVENVAAPRKAPRRSTATH